MAITARKTSKVLDFLSGLCFSPRIFQVGYLVWSGIQHHSLRSKCQTSRALFDIAFGIYYGDALRAILEFEFEWK